MIPAGRGAPGAEGASALTLLDVLRRSTDFLQRAGVARPRLEAELLISRALGVGRLGLYLQFDRPMAAKELERPRELVRRRARGTPTAYLLGEREFYGLAFRVGPGVLIPRPESELLVELALSRISQRPGPWRVADLGTGSGCLAITVAVKAAEAWVEATDISEEALEVARGNAQRHLVVDRVTFRPGSWAQVLTDREPFDLVLSNPPYIARQELQGLEREVRDFEPLLALDGGEDGLDSYRELLPQLPSILATRGLVLLEVDCNRAAEVAELCRESFPGAGVSSHRDLSGRERVVEVGPA